MGYVNLHGLAITIICGNIKGNEFVGGITGRITRFGSISNCYNMGTMSNNSNSTVTTIYMGGISGDIAINKTYKIENCYSAGKIIINRPNQEATIAAGNITGNHINGTIENCYYEKNGIEGIGTHSTENCVDDITEVESKEMKTQKMIELLNGEEIIYCYDKTNINNGYPILEWQYISILRANSNVKIDEENRVIKGIKPQTLAEDFMKILQIEAEYEILDLNGNIVNNDAIIGTDYKVKTAEGKEYTVIVWGDFTGDGKIGIAELASASKLAVESRTLTLKQKAILDVSMDGNVKITDLAALSKFAAQ